MQIAIATEPIAKAVFETTTINESINEITNNISKIIAALFLKKDIMPIFPFNNLLSLLSKILKIIPTINPIQKNTEIIMDIIIFAFSSSYEQIGDKQIISDEIAKEIICANIIFLLFAKSFTSLNYLC